MHGSRALRATLALALSSGALVAAFAPTYRPDNEPSTITFSSPTLTLPTRAAGTTTLTAIES
jgi:hypothetical protein